MDMGGYMLDVDLPQAKACELKSLSLAGLNVLNVCWIEYEPVTGETVRR